jgi:hypothetical protein
MLTGMEDCLQGMISDDVDSTLRESTRVGESGRSERDRKLK